MKKGGWKRPEETRAKIKETMRSRRDEISRQTKARMADPASASAFRMECEPLPARLSNYTH